MTDKLHSWEKWPIIAVFIAQGLYVFVWYAGQRMPGLVTAFLPWLYVLGGLAAWGAIDGAMIATVTGMRQGRRSRWSVAAIVITATFGAGLALDLYGALPVAANWLHAGFALTIVSYLMHLATPPASETPAQLKAALNDAATRAAQAETEAAQLRNELEQVRNDVDTARNEGATAAAASDAAAAQARREMQQAQQRAARAEAEAATLRDELAQVAIQIGSGRYTLRDVGAAFETSPSSVLRRLNKIETASAAD